MGGDRELCTAAVARDGKAFQWASEEMNGDRELCMAAVTQDGKALQWASEEMKEDKMILQTAFQQRGCKFTALQVENCDNEAIILAYMQFARGQRWNTDVAFTNY